MGVHNNEWQINPRLSEVLYISLFISVLGGRIVLYPYVDHSEELGHP